MRFRVLFGSALAVLSSSLGLEAAQTPSVAAAQTPSAAATAPAQWPAECRLTRVATLPMTEHDGHVMVPVAVNGTTLNFIVDTGGYVTAISARVADVLGMKRHGIRFNRITDVAGKAADFYVTADTFQMSHEVAKHFELMVAPLGPGEDGILAPDLLANFDVELDFGGMTLNLFRHRPCSEWTVYWTSAFITLPFNMSERTHLRTDVTLDGKDTLAILDTGAPTSLLSFEEADDLFDLNGKSPGVQPLGMVGGASGGVVKSYRYPFKALTMGGVIVSNPHILLTAGDNFLRTDRASLLLGMDVLRHLHIYIAYRDRTLYISDAAAN